MSKNEESKFRDDLPSTPEVPQDRRSTIGSISGVTGETADERGLGYAAAMDAGMYAARLRDKGIGTPILEEHGEAETQATTEENHGKGGSHIGK